MVAHPHARIKPPARLRRWRGRGRAVAPVWRGNRGDGGDPRRWGPRDAESRYWDYLRSSQTWTASPSYSAALTCVAFGGPAFFQSPGASTLVADKISMPR